MSTWLTDSVSTLGSNPLLTNEISHQPRESKGVEISITRHRNTITLPCASCHEYQLEAIIAKTKNNLDASLGVDHPRWSFLGANKNSITPMPLSSCPMLKMPVCDFDSGVLFKLDP
ncbi:MAG TPA: hypothetical protein D7I07_06530 [Candidatus Poseidoniales archaeon]|nr:MAG TPA: hypothetical protein D7I07_06530 [Candidatus Poseidoniales archaeon]